MRHLPNHSPILPALRDAEAVLGRLQARQQALVDAGRAAESARLWGRITRVAHWQAAADAPVFRAAPARNWLDALIAEVNLGGAFGTQAEFGMAA